MADDALSSSSISNCLEILQNHCKDLYVQTFVSEVDDVPKPLNFYREWVAPNKPLVIRNAVTWWPAITKWNDDYLRQKMGDQEITVAVTPNGYADAVCGDHFVLPEERKMTLSSFLNVLNGLEQRSGIFYIQKQNSNLSDEFSPLLEDVEPEIPWASEAFGKAPDAMNFWMGDGHAITSMHRDHYENIYCVIRGKKQFVLLPPTDLPWVPYKEYNQGVYKETSSGHFEIVDITKEAGKVSWIPVDPLNPDLDTYPEYKHASPVVCTLGPGDALYLPSLWFHHVRQSHGCIAVNYWYDMEFDIKYCYYKFLESVVNLRQKTEKS